jgi:competence protein ComEA helix-hairpin-helix repeat region
MAGLVNINKASLEELMSLPGIGQAKAQLILDYRTEHGVFAVKEDLMKISGIKDGIYKKIKDLITIT